MFVFTHNLLTVATLFCLNDFPDTPRVVGGVSLVVVVRVAIVEVNIPTVVSIVLIAGPVVGASKRTYENYHL